MEKSLGKITDVKFGLGGYQNARIGLHVRLGNAVWSDCDSRSTWDAETIKWSNMCKWSESERESQYVNIMCYVSKLLKDAKVDSVDKLKDIPIEDTFDGNKLIDWRILTEVL